MKRKLLVTGDFWHRDFRKFLADCDSVTLQPLTSLAAAASGDFDLVVIAQSRPDQFPLETIESVQRQYAGTPIVAILGSWCEGELRTGAPWPGVVRIYWHQWAGRYESFLQQLTSQGMTSLHQPATASTADRIVQTDQQPHGSHTASQQTPNQRPTQPPTQPHLLTHFRQKNATDATAEIHCVGISAWTQIGFEMLADAVKHFGWQPRWIEQTTWDRQSAGSVSAICVEADSMSTALEQRLRWLQSEFPTSAVVLVLNFPRHEDSGRAKQWGVSCIVSKPFELANIQHAIEQAVELNVEQAAFQRKVFPVL